MTKDKDIKTVVPALRFPEFRGEEGWNKKPLIKVAHVIAGQSPEGSNYNENGVGMPFYQGKTDFGEIFINSPTKWTTQTTKTANEGDILMSVRAPVGTLNISTNEICIGRGLAAIQPCQNKWFLYYFLNSIQNSIIGNGGSVFDSINKDQIEKIEILVPKNPKEQDMIANCLGSLDDLISAVADKIEALKEYKKGLMQQLFPAEGKTTPALRFPKFQNTGEWKNKILSDVCKLVRGPFGGALKKEIFVEDGYAVYEQSHAIYGDMNAFRYYITEDKFNELIRFAVCPNDIIMSCSGTMGKFAVIPNSHKKGVINQALLKLSTKKGNDYRFIKLLLELPGNQEQLLSESAGGAIKNVASVGQIKEMSLCVPELKEQQKIADCLSSVDDLISAETDKLDQLKIHKKGLMQQLFLSPNE